MLREIEAMINDVGARILGERGHEEAHPDFGIEIVAEDSIAFKKGSVRATIAITRFVEVGLLAATEVIQTVNTLGTKKRPALESASSETLSARVVRGLDRIAFINQTGKTNTKLEVKAPRPLLVAANIASIATRRATFGDRAVESLRSLRVPAFEENNVRLYGKLFRLRDKPMEDDGKNTFWGELYADNGQRWRIQFKVQDLPLVSSLFTQRVLIVGTATYYHSASPKLEASHIERDLDRDTVSAYHELYGCDRDLNEEGRLPS